MVLIRPVRLVHHRNCCFALTPRDILCTWWRTRYTALTGSDSREPSSNVQHVLQHWSLRNIPGVIKKRRETKLNVIIISGHTKSSSSHEENNSVSSPKNKLQPQKTKVNIIISFAFRHCAGRALIYIYIYILRIHSEWKKTHTIRRTPPIRSNQWLTLVPSHPPLQGSHRATKLTLVLLTNLSYRQPLHSTRICRLHARGNPPFCIIRLESALQSDWTNSCRRAKQNQASLQQYWATPSTTEGHR